MTVAAADANRSSPSLGSSNETSDLVIKDQDALKTWMTKVLEPVAQADLDHLVMYIIRLLKKRRSEKEFRSDAIEKLKIFINQKKMTTPDFVDMLIDAVKSSSYLANEPSSSSNNGGGASNKRTRSPPGPSESVKEKVSKTVEPKVIRAPLAAVTAPSSSPPSVKSVKSRLGGRGGSPPPTTNKRSRSRSPRRADWNSRRNDRHRRDDVSYRKRGRSRSRSRSPRSRRRSRSPRSRSPPATKSSSGIGASKPGVCPSYERQGYCIAGDKCPFPHPGFWQCDQNELQAITKTGDEKPASVSTDPVPPLVLPPPLKAPIGEDAPVVSLPSGAPPPGFPGPFPPFPGAPSNAGMFPPPFIAAMMGMPPGMPFPPRMPEPSDAPASNLVSVTEGGGFGKRHVMPPNGEWRGRGRGGRGGFRGRGGGPHHNSGGVGNIPKERSLIVRCIPHQQNTISALMEHFAKFGNLLSVVVQHDGDPGAALLTFSEPYEALAAYRNPEPLFNNRHVRVFWHDPERQARLAPLAPKPKEEDDADKSEDKKGDAGDASGAKKDDEETSAVVTPPAPVVIPDPSKLSGTFGPGATFQPRVPKPPPVRIPRNQLVINKAAEQARANAKAVRANEADLLQKRKEILATLVAQQKTLFKKLETVKGQPASATKTVKKKELVEMIKLLDGKIQNASQALVDTKLQVAKSQAIRAGAHPAMQERSSSVSSATGVPGSATPPSTSKRPFGGTNPSAKQEPSSPVVGIPGLGDDDVDPSTSRPRLTSQSSDSGHNLLSSPIPKPSTTDLSTASGLLNHVRSQLRRGSESVDPLSPTKKQPSVSAQISLDDSTPSASTKPAAEEDENVKKAAAVDLDDDLLDEADLLDHFEDELDYIEG